MTRIKIPDNIARIQPYVPGKPIEEVEREFGLKDSVKLASNENPLGPSPRAVETLRKAASGVHRYPDGGGFYLRNRLSEIHGLPANQIILGNGSTELVEILARTFLGQDGNAVIAEQSFIMYRLAVTAVNGNARLVPLKKMKYDLPTMSERVDGATRLVYIANPNNPTGTYIAHRELVDFLEGVSPEVLIVLDEAYREYVERPDYPDSLALLKQGKRIAILRTFSKIHGLAGLRVGYALTLAGIVEAAERVRSPFNTNSLAQAAALAALDDRDHVERSRRHNTEQRGFVQKALEGDGVRFIESVANFVLVDTGRNAEEVFSALVREGVIIRPMSAYDLPTWVRVTIGTHAENLAFLRAIRKLLRPGKFMKA
ncbi:MAG: histidinol-phosphate transaminase [Acidobacteriota bacterium]